MKPFLLSMLLGVALLALACGGGKKPSVSATPTTVGPPPTPTAVPKSDIDRLLANAGDEVAGWLRAQPWVYDGSDASLAVVESITSAAFDSDPAKAKAESTTDFVIVVR